MFSKYLGTLLVAAAALIATSQANGDILFESGTLGVTGIPRESATATNVNQFVYPGVRFYLSQPAITSQIGGHFVSESSGTFFGAIVVLEDANDFPNSSDLSTLDVLGTTSLTFPVPSAEVFGNLEIQLDPGWYALVFGSGLFGTSGDGAALRNNPDIGDPSYIGYGPNLNWFNLEIFQTHFVDHRFVVTGNFVPEPSTLTLLLLIALWPRRHAR